MEGIVVGIAQINFHQNINGLTSENSAPKFTKAASSIMTDCESTTSEEPTSIIHQDIDYTFNSLSKLDSIDNSDWEEVKDDIDQKIQYKMGYTFAERRQMPFRASKESSSLGIKRRSIIKPTKRTRNQEDVQNLKPSDIKKIYLNQKLTKFKTSSLETIFEETTSLCNNEQDCSRLMGGRKLKRLLSFSNGFKYNKTVLNKRRAKIKKTFGKRFALKKISLEEFITKLNTSIDKDDNVLNDCQMENKKSEIMHSEMVTSNVSANLNSANNYVPTTKANIDNNENSLNIGCQMESDRNEILHENLHSEILASNSSENLNDSKNHPPTASTCTCNNTMSL